MEYIKLGTSDLKVSRIGLGTWAIGGLFWGGTDESNSIKTIRQALELGINLIDTAPVYGLGLSEEIVGKAVAEYGQREKVILATKAGIEWTGRPEDGNWQRWRSSQPQAIKKELEASLRRLKTDYIDLYQIHWPDPETPFEETAEALHGLYEEGKIRAIGVSNYNIEQMDAWRKVAPLHSCQPQLNLFESHLSDTVFTYCAEQNIGTLTWGTLAHGLLTGKFTANSTFPSDDLRHNNPMFKGDRFRQYLAAVDELKALAAEKGKTVAQLAVRWALQQPGVSVALWGARRPDQLEETLGVSGWTLSAHDLSRIEAILSKHIKDPVTPSPNPGPPPRSKV
jgi:aryl-alcohol dehydrogenase-like predicted oxidoreductase